MLGETKLLRKLLIGAFIFFHSFCVVAWVLPKPSPVKSALLSLRLPFLPREVVGTYLYNTAQWQGWEMFAPNPLQVNLYVDATVYFRDGSHQLFTLPRLALLNRFEATVQKRYRKYQQNLPLLENAVFRDDFARYIARQYTHDPANLPVRVTINLHESPIPRHDRAELQKNKGAWIDYTRVLREEAQYTTTVLRDYTVRPEDGL